MNVDTSLFWFQEALRTALMLGAPLLGMALVVGVLISLFQAITSIQEMSLSFISKLLGVTAVLFVLAPWMLQLLSDFAARVFTYIPNISH